MTSYYAKKEVIVQRFPYNENKQRGTFDFPFQFHHVTHEHSRYIMPYHWHVEFELIRILQGSLEFTQDVKTFLAKEGDVIFIGSGILHAAIPHNCIYECIVFDMNTFVQYNDICRKFIQQILNYSVIIFHHFSKEHKKIHETVWDIFEAFKKGQEGYQLVVLGQFYHFFGIVYREHLYFTDMPQTPRDHKRIHLIKKVLRFIEDSYASSITLEQLSSIVHMSPKYFCKFFFEITHMTPMDYVNQYRIEQACHQLLTTDFPITEVAFNCGFNDSSYFIKVFKKYKGTTPKKYLKQ